MFIKKIVIASLILFNFDLHAERVFKSSTEIEKGQYKLRSIIEQPMFFIPSPVRVHETKSRFLKNMFLFWADKFQKSYITLTGDFKFSEKNLISTEQFALKEAAHGRIALSYHDIKGEKRVASFGFDWIHTPKSEAFRIKSFLGDTLAMIKIMPYVAYFTNEKGQTYVSTSVKDIAVRVFNFELPLDVMFQWLNGKPSTKSFFTIKKRKDHYVRFNQVGWEVRVYKDFDTIKKIKAKQITSNNKGASFKAVFTK